MAEEEKSPTRKTESGKPEKEGASSERAKAGGEKKAVYKAQEGTKDAREADPKFEQREALLREAFQRVKGEGKIREEGFNSLLTLLKKKDLEELSEKEKASIWEILLILLKFLWKEMKKLFKEQEYAELLAVARKAGAKSDEEIFLWMIGETGIKATSLGELQDIFTGKAFDERQKEGKRTPEEERGRLEQMREGRIQGGKGELSEEEKEEVAKMEPSQLQAAARNTEAEFEEWEKFASQVIERHAEISPDIVEHKAAIQRLRDELRRLETIPESGQDVGRIADLQRQLELENRTFKGLLRGLGKEEFMRNMYFYGRWAVVLMGEIEKYREDEVFKLIAKRPGEVGIQDVQEVADKLDARGKKASTQDRELSGTLKLQAESLRAWVGEQGQAEQFTAMSAEERQDTGAKLKEKVRRDIVKPLIEKVIGDAEDDPREGFRMRPGGDILFSELMDAIRTAGPTGRYDKQMFENEFYARRVVQFIQSEMIKRADPEALVKIGGSLFSEDLDTLMRLEPGLGPARRIVERALAQTPRNPENDGRIPNTYLNPELRGEYQPPVVEKLVAEQLMELSNQGWLFDKDGNHFKMKAEEAERMAALAMKISNLELRTAEHLSLTPLPPKAHFEHIKSTPQDKMRFDIMRFTGERFERFGQGREAIWPIIRRMNQFVQPGVYEKIPGVAFDEWEVNPENFLHIGGIDSASTWRILAATKEVRELDLALGVQLYDPDKNKGEIWTKAGERLPTVISRYFPMLALRKAESEGEYFNLESRLRDGLLRDENKKAFLDYVERKVKQQINDEVFEEIKKELIDDVESKLVRYRGGKAAAESALKEVKTPEDISKAENLGVLGSELDKRYRERQKELKLQVGAQAAFLAVVAEAHGIPFQGDWENKAWEKWEDLQKRLTVLEEKALQEYAIKAREARQAGRDLPEYQRILDLAGQEGYSREDLQIVERLTYLGNSQSGAEEQAEKAREEIGKLNDRELMEKLRKAKLLSKEEQASLIITPENKKALQERLVRARFGERLADEDVKFSYIAFTEDILHEDARWQELGSADILRRYGDTQMAADGAELMWKVASGLAGQQDKVIATRQELLKSLVEFQETLGYLRLSDRQKVTATLTHEIINNLFKADAWWLNIPLIGPMLDMEWPWGSMLASSRAQRKFGLKSLSMTAMERWRFIEDMRPFVGNQYADKLQLMLKARRRDAVWQLARQWGLPAAAYLGWEWVLGPALKQLQVYMSDIAR